MSVQFKKFIFAFVAMAVAALQFCPQFAVANNYCPFCSAVGQTISEKINAADVVVLATLKNQPQQKLVIDSDELPQGEFEVTQIVRGEKYISKGEKFETVLVGRYDVGTMFMVIGVDAPNVAWSTPMKVTERAVKYVDQLIKLPKSGPKRLVFFQDFLQDEESMLAFDAYDEFARAPYADLIAMKKEMKHDELIKWIQDDEIPVNRKRLYYTMLGVCGTQDDIKVFEKILRSGDRKKQRGLDALVACYLNLKKADGLKLINEVFLTNPEADYVDLFSVVSALRFHGSEVDFIKKSELVKSMRLVLNRPKDADMVIPDLIRWEDWTVVDKMIELFEQPAEKTSSFIRVPIAQYLLVCPKKEAKAAVAKIRKIDAKSVERAEKMLQWEMGLEEDDDDDIEMEQSDLKKEDSSDNKKSKDKKSTDKKGKNPFPKNSTNSSDRDDSDRESAAGDQKSIGEQMHQNFHSVGALSAGMQDHADFEANPEPAGGEADSAEPIRRHVVGKVPLDEKTADTVTKAGTDAEKVSVTVPVQGNETFVKSTPAAERPAPSNSSPKKNVNENITEPIASHSTWQGTVAIIMVPLTICIFLFLLSWSVINGWFERLIY